MKRKNANEVNYGYMAAIALIVLFLGSSYYWLFRLPESALFLALLPDQAETIRIAFIDQWLGWLPTFLHVLAFSLLTFLVLGHRYALFSSIIWGAVNAVFEIGQALPIGYLQSLSSIPYLYSYLVTGVFDPLDLFACVLGGLVAWRFFISKKHLHADSNRLLKKSGQNCERCQKRQPS